MKHWLVRKQLNSQLLYYRYNPRKHNCSTAEEQLEFKKSLSFSLLCTHKRRLFQRAMKSIESFSDCISPRDRWRVNEPTFPFPYRRVRSVDPAEMCDNASRRFGVLCFLEHSGYNCEGTWCERSGQLAGAGGLLRTSVTALQTQPGTAAFKRVFKNYKCDPFIKLSHNSGAQRKRLNHGFVCFTEVAADGNGKGLLSKIPELYRTGGALLQA